MVLIKKLTRGWVQDNNKIGGSKRRRRYKKDSRRFLTEEELKRLRADKEILYVPSRRSRK